MPDYSKSKIYKIVNSIDDEEYYGSTTNPLYKRWGQHKQAAKKELKSSKLYSKIRELGIEKFKIILVENYPCENIDELKSREHEWIKTKGKLNIQQPCRTRKEYFEDNKKKILLWNAEWSNKNKEELLLKKKQYYERKKDDILKRMADYYNINKEHIADKGYTYRAKNKDKLQRKYVCDCGGYFTYNHKSEHEKTKKHMNYANNI